MKSSYRIKPFKTVHVVPSQGYIVYHRKSKLKPEWQGAAQADIVAAKRRGDAITTVLEVQSCCNQISILLQLCVLSCLTFVATVHILANFASLHGVAAAAAGGTDCYSSSHLQGAVQTPEVAFTGDTAIDFVTQPGNEDVLRARVLVMECTFMDDKVDQDGAKERGHTHLQDIAAHAASFQVRDC